MAFLAFFCLLDCDHCKQTLALKTDADWEGFERDWHSGMNYQFCPTCRFLDVTIARQIEDKQWSQRIENTITVTV